MRNRVKHMIGADRPVNVPEGWRIFNAPRPLVGDLEWQADFIHGIFYAAVDLKERYGFRWDEVTEKIQRQSCEHEFMRTALSTWLPVVEEEA